MGGEPQAALGDIAEIAQAAGVQHRTGEVGVGPGEQVDERQQRHRGERQRRRPAAPPGAGAPRSPPRRRRRRPASRSRRRHRRRSVRPRRRRRRRPIARKAARGPRGDSPGANPARPPRSRRRSAPPAAPRARCRSRRSGPPARVGAQQRERRQRRAGDDVDRVGEHRQPRGHAPVPGSRRTAPASAPPAAGAPSIAISISTPSPARPPPPPAAPAAGRRPPSPRAGPRRARRPRRSAASAEHHQASRLNPITGPRRSEITAIRAPSVTTAAASTSPSPGSAAPTSARDLDPEPFEDRRRDVGGEHVSVEPGAVRGQVAGEPPPGDPDRQRPVFTGGGRSIAISRSFPAKPAHQGRAAAQRSDANRARHPSPLSVQPANRLDLRRRRPPSHDAVEYQGRRSPAHARGSSES